MIDETQENLPKTDELADNIVVPDDEVLDGNIATDIESPLEGEKMSPRKMFLVVGGILAACLLLVVTYLYYSRGHTADANTATGADAAKTETVVSVKVAKAEKQPIAEEFTAIGNVAPAQASIVAASISAQIKQMRLLKNQFVQKGEILAVLASQDIEAQRNEANAALDEARLNLQTLQKVTIPQTRAQTEKDLADATSIADNARSTYERRRDLYSKGGISLKELEASGLALKNAENALRLAQNNTRLNTSAVNPNAKDIAETKIKQAQARLNTISAQANLAEVRAPISGVVTEQFQFQGEFASAGARLLTIADTGTVIVKANFADTVVANLQMGDAVNIYLPSASDERMLGKVTLISRSADPQNRSVEIWASFFNGRGLLRVGDAVQFVVSSNTVNDAIVIPTAAMTLDAAGGDEGAVFVVDKDSIAHERKVKIGIKHADQVQILEGLAGGETVVVEGNYALPDGTKVEIAKDSPGAEN